MFVKHCKVEVYLTELKLSENGNINNVVARRFSKADTIGMLICGVTYERLHLMPFKACFKHFQMYAIDLLVKDEILHG